MSLEHGTNIENEIQPDEEITTEGERYADPDQVLPNYVVPDEGYKELRELRDKLRKNIGNSADEFANQLENEIKKQIKIQKVPKIMRQNDNSKKFYQRKVMSIGPPFKALKKEKALKLTLAGKFIKESGKTEESLLKVIKDNIQDLKECFGAGVIPQSHRNNDSQLVMSLFLDGCAILQFIYSYMYNGLDEFNINNAQATLIEQDMLLLGNQIPFKVLQLLMKSILDDTTVKPIGRQKKIQKLRIAIISFIHKNNFLVMTVNWRSLKQTLIKLIFENEDTQPVHLLDLLRSALLFRGHNMKDKKILRCCFDFLPHLCRKNPSSGHKESIETLPISHNSYGSNNVNNLQQSAVLHNLRANNNYVDNHGDRKWSFRNVKELTTVGIKLKSSGSCSLKDIYFSSSWYCRAKLTLPLLIVDDKTERKMMNLASYEMSFENSKIPCDFEVTSYLQFMDLLIDDEQDVKDLRAAHIIRNRLSSDGDVARMFNRMGSNSLAPPKDFYLNVKNDIQSHCDKMCATSVAEVIHNYFRSPWSCIALVAATIAFLFAGAATWFTIFPRK